jgi:DtxR family transcriptional regulator, Mn-dependent transcriptional regulator
VTDDEPEVLRYFAELGIRPGASLAVLAREYDGPITIAIGEERLSLGTGLAGRVMVDLVSDVTAPAH